MLPYSPDGAILKEFPAPSGKIGWRRLVGTQAYISNAMAVDGRLEVLAHRVVGVHEPLAPPLAVGRITRPRPPSVGRAIGLKPQPLGGLERSAVLPEQETIDAPSARTIPRRSRTG